MDALNTDQLVLEVRYLRATVAPHIKERQQVKVSDKWTCPTLSDEQLRQNIKNIIRQETDLADVEVLGMGLSL